MTPQIRATEKVDRTIRQDSAHERDANGQQAWQDQQQQGPMSDEQFEKALEHLRQLTAVKDNNWSVTVEKSDGKRTVLIKDAYGNLIRRIPEAELWSLPLDQSSSSPKGQLLKRTA